MQLAIMTNILPQNIVFKQLFVFRNRPVDFAETQPYCSNCKLFKTCIGLQKCVFGTQDFVSGQSELYNAARGDLAIKNKIMEIIHLLKLTVLFLPFHPHIINNNQLTVDLSKNITPHLYILSNEISQSGCACLFRK